MGLLSRARGARDWLGAARLLRRLRAQAGAGAIDPAGPGAPPRPAALRPSEDHQVGSRLGRWRRRSSPPPAGGGLSAAERAAAMRRLDELRAQMTDEQGRAIDAHLAAGAVTVRRLDPRDGYVWEMPGTRVFAIVGVQAFTVRDEPADEQAP
ncbi:MAG: hypothetical protein AB7V42_04190 [Thermoleophilia bacterium]